MVSLQRSIKGCSRNGVGMKRVYVGSKVDLRSKKGSICYVSRVKLLIYNSMFASHLNYCCLIWGHTGAVNLHKLRLAEKNVKKRSKFNV